MIVQSRGVDDIKDSLKLQEREREWGERDTHRQTDKNRDRN